MLGETTHIPPQWVSPPERAFTPRQVTGKQSAKMIMSALHAQKIMYNSTFELLSRP